MALMEKLKSVIGSDQTQTYQYRCGECEAEFAGDSPNPNQVECPECGSDRIHSAI